MKFKPIGKTLATVGLAGMLGLGAYEWIKPRESTRVPIEPKSEWYSKKPQGIVKHPFRDNKLYISDEDGDGQADVLHYMTLAHWIAEGHKTEFLVREGDTNIMTPEIREAATQAMKADQNLRYSLAKRTYELEKEKE